MPTYDFQCQSCSSTFEQLISISRCDEPQSCPTCGGGAKRIFTPPEGGFILAGDGWAGKNIRIAGQMAQKNRRLNTKQDVLKREAPAVTLTPNVDGEHVSSWSEAKKLAASKGKDASTYNNMVRKEST